MGSIAAVATLLACVGIPTAIAHAADCLTAPYFAAPEGSHWYYQTDRATQRKCWFLRAAGEPAQHTNVPAKKTRAFENATASAGALLSKSSAEVPLPSLKPEPMGSATTADLVDQSAPAENTSPSSRERSLAADRSGDFTGDRRWVTRSPRGCYSQCGGTQCRCERCPRSFPPTDFGRWDARRCRGPGSGRPVHRQHHRDGDLSDGDACANVFNCRGWARRGQSSLSRRDCRCASPAKQYRSSRGRRDRRSKCAR